MTESARFNTNGPKIGLSVRLAETPQEIEAAQRLRYRVFAEELGADIQSEDGRDTDRYDEHCSHLLAFDEATGEIIGCYRLLTAEGAQKVGGWYSAGEFDLSPLADILPQTVELGRACIHPDYRHGGLIMLLWTGLMKFMKEHNLRFMIGCGSISTADGGHEAAGLYHVLKQKYLAPEQWRVTPLNPMKWGELTPAEKPECPALIKGYLKAGAWFCGEPCVDEAFNCADILIMMDISQLSDRYLQRFAPTI
ncbi:GNAT family N-acetyltransferase [Neisseria animalis]|uniref:L-ornithine N(alpha)-acyltransferase n=1 Tax=Neisseria animalis TaxID=492 RepID=A0A5P3MRI6_NEIAN|nr:GNAT family N-acetyltransferase [Neisseria animalis]QEY24060.1 GNAT family N-acetyltransferase [Neisseria animalis]ROW32703.1 GNAT family N-acetyltransferase [Neisseria animalis]VEE06192.1 putative autoinducer synthesis protein [Neisseria animalis]